MRYLAHGFRWYGKKTIQPMRRELWEFQAVIEGEISPIYNRIKKNSPLRSSYLWLHPPDSEHGWKSPSEMSSKVIVWHFPNVPSQLSRALKRKTCLGKKLNEKERRKMSKLLEELRPHYKSPRRLSALIEQRVLIELSIIMLGQDGDSPVNTNSIVEQALKYFEEHLHEAPTITQVSKEAHISVAHLRRLFHDNFNKSPQSIFDDIRFAKVCELLSEGELKNQTIAELCGYSSAIALSHAFKKRYQLSPRKWKMLNQV